MNFIIQSILVFFAVAIMDVFWTRYFQATTESHAVKAGFFSALIIIFSAFTARSYVHDGALSIPAAVGAFVGTWATVKYHKKEKKNDN